MSGLSGQSLAEALSELIFNLRISDKVFPKTDNQSQYELNKSHSFGIVKIHLILQKWGDAIKQVLMYT